MGGEAWRLLRVMVIGAVGTAGAAMATQAQEVRAEQGGQAEADPLKPVVVTATRIGAAPFNVPASIALVSGDDLRNGRAGVNLSEGLGGVPGLLIKDRQNYAQDLQLSIRGFGARSSFGVRGLRLYVDGVPATMPDGQGQTSNFDIASMERIEILSGPFSALYGNASGGVIAAWTEEGSLPPVVEADFVAGSFGMFRYGLKASGAGTATTSAGEPVFDYNVSASRFTTDGYRDHSAARKNLGNAKLDWRPDADSKFTLVLNSVDLTAQDPLGLTRPQYESNPRGAALAEQYNTRKTVTQTQGGLRYERHLGADDTLEAMVYYGHRGTTQYQAIPPSAQISPLSAGAVIDLDRDYGGTDLRWTHRTAFLGGPLTLVGGVAYDSLYETRRGYNNFTGPLAAPTLGVQGALRRDERNTVWNFDQYLQAKWNVSPRWELEAGLRHTAVAIESSDRYITPTNGDDSGSVRYDKFLPVGSLRFLLTPAVNLYASVGRGFETPTLNEISYQPSGAPGLNFNLRPSDNVSVEVGAKAKVAGGLATAALFRTTTDDEIVTATSVGGRSTYRNAGRTLRQGFELGWNGRMLRHLQTQFAWSYLAATYRDDINPGITAGNQIPGTGRQAVYGSVGWVPPSGWRASVEMRYLSAVYVDDRNTDRAPGFFTTGISAGYVLPIGRWKATAYVRVDNLFDRKYAGSVIVNESNARYFEPAPGRNASGGVTLAYSF
jgi:iron complex outermembrane receptor protein